MTGDPYVVVVGTLDSKGEEHQYVAGLLTEWGCSVKLVDVGCLGDPSVTPDISFQEIVRSGGAEARRLLGEKDRGKSVGLVSQLAADYIAELSRTSNLVGIISLGGGGGTAIGTAIMRRLPIGLPKVMVSTLASGQTSHYLGTKDIVLFPSLVDVSGLNRISRQVFRQAAAALFGMVERGADSAEVNEDKPLIAASMFGNTTECVDHARMLLEEAGYEVLVFHATGAGGMMMESLIAEGAFAGVLDLTTTELADEVAGGVLSAGPDRLGAAAESGVPTVIAPGCLDMVNFGEPETVPEQYADRLFYHHNPQVTLMRTSVAESQDLGARIGAAASAYTGPVSVLFPRRGLSVIGMEGQAFYNEEADGALLEALKGSLKSDKFLTVLDHSINDREFAAAAVDKLLSLIKIKDGGR